MIFFSLLKSGAKNTLTFSVFVIYLLNKTKALHKILKLIDVMYNNIIIKWTTIF